MLLSVCVAATAYGLAGAWAGMTEEIPEGVERANYIKGIRDGMVLKDSFGLNYHMDRKPQANGRIRWRCGFRKSRGCKARLYTLNGWVVAKSLETHNHDVDNI